MKQADVSLRALVYAALFAALTAVGAYITIPLPFVPITLQTVFVLLAGTLLGKAGGVSSQIVYLLMGMLGFPVFSGGRAGLGVLLGPTGGYLWGFIFAALVVGAITEKTVGRNVEKKLTTSKYGDGWMLLAFLCGEAALFACGVLQLSMTAQMSFYKAIMVGVLPFLPGEALKIALAFFIAKALRKRIKI